MNDRIRDEVRPTNVRRLIIAAASVSAILLYLDRVCISIMGTYLQNELMLSRVEMSWVFGAFFFSYALAQVPSGGLADRFGSRRMLAIYVFAWSAMTVATGWATSLALLIVARLACGVAQSGAYPTAAGLLRRWIPIQDRGLSNGVVTVGGRIGGAAAPLVTAWLLVAFVPPSASSSKLASTDLRNLPGLVERISTDREEAGVAERAAAKAARERLKGSRKIDADSLNAILADPTFPDAMQPIRSTLSLSREVKSIWNMPAGERSAAEVERLNRLLIEIAFPEFVRPVYGDGLRPVFLVYGLLGVPVALFVYFLLRDKPSLHPWCNQAEIDLVDDLDGASSAKARLDWRTIVLDRNLTFSSITQFGINVGWIFIITLLPDFLSVKFNVPIEERGLMTTVPLLTACVFMPIGGKLTDVLARRLGIRLGRCLPIGLTQFVCALACFSCPILPNAWAVTIALSISAASVDLGVPAIWAFTQDVAGRNVGAALGWANMWGNLGAALSPVLLAQVQAAAGWNATFAVCGIAFVVAGISGLMIDATRPLGAPKGRSTTAEERA